MKRGFVDILDLQDLNAAGDGELLREEEATAGMDGVSGEGAYGFDPMEIWLERGQERNNLDIVNNSSVSIVLADDHFSLNLSDLPCMSSSSSTTSILPAASVLAKQPSGSSCSPSSSSAASWAVDNKIQLQPGDLSSASSMDEAGALLPSDECFTVEDCINVVENLESMDLIYDGDDIWDPGSIFQTENSGEFQAEEQQTPSDQYLQENDDGLSFMHGNSELAVIFFEWLKQNKDYISAEDMRSIKLKRSTIESASKRLGSSKEGKKQLLKLILDWVEQYQLQKKKMRGAETAPTTSDHQSSAAQFQENVLNSNTIINHTTPNFMSCNPDLTTRLYPPPLVLPYAPESCPAVMPAQPTYVFQPPAHIGGDCACYFNGPSFNISSMNQTTNYSCAIHLPPPQYQAIDYAQSWLSSQFVTSNAQFNPFTDDDKIQALYGSHYPYQLFDGNGKSLVRLGSSATKEARKKRMARHRKRPTHHHHYHNHPNQDHNQNDQDRHSRMGSGENCTMPQINNPAGNWVYWSSAAAGPSQMVMTPPAEAFAHRPHWVDRPSSVISQNHHTQGSPEQQQGLKTEKNLKFLLQKVLKQSDVGNLGRIVLPKKEAECHLPELESRDGISIAMEDICTSRVWNMKYRFWPNNKSRMYLLENTGEFVRTKGLQEGDFIVIYADTKSGKYLIRGVKVRQSEPKIEGKKPARKNLRTSSSAATSSPLPLFKQVVMN